MTQPLTAAILVVSTTAAQDPSSDAATSVLQGVLQEQGPDKWRVTDSRIVTDDALAIQKQIRNWTDGPGDAPHLVITSGGTGFAVSDVTPEVGPNCFSDLHDLPWF